MNNQDKFLKDQKVLRLATVGNKKIPHIVPVWFLYRSKKICIGTNTRTQKVKNIMKNKKVCFCLDVGVNSPDIYGIMCQGNANLILEYSNVKFIAKKILRRYFEDIKNKSALELLDDTDCIIEITPEKWSTWSY